MLKLIGSLLFYELLSQQIQTQRKTERLETMPVLSQYVYLCVWQPYFFTVNSRGLFKSYTTINNLHLIIAKKPGLLHF